MKTKNKKAISTLIAVTVALSILVAFSATASAATTWYVDDGTCPASGSGSQTDPYCKIQDAIDAASAGDTINVEPGTYNEAITINKNDLTIQSTGTAANTIIHASSTGFPPPYMYAVEITANGVTFQGFTVKYDWTYGKLCGIKLDGASGCTVSDNVGDVGNEAGIYLDNSDNNIISGNDFSNNAVDNGIYLYYSDGNEIVGNDVSSLTGYKPKGIQMNMADNNLVHGHTINSDRYAIWIYQGCSGNKIYENELSSNTRAGIYCEWSAGSGNEIYDNTISGNPVGILWLGSNNEIYENDITGNTDKGIWLFAGNGNTIHCNNIVGNVNYGVYNSVSEVDATCNWWGDTSGPTHSSNPSGSGDAVSDNVDFDPWAGKITGPTDPVEVNTSIDVTGYFTCDMTTATFDWGDETTTTHLDVSEQTSVTESHIYDTAGVYTVELTVGDGNGFTFTTFYQYVVVYDPSAGFVTGGGWINSPAGAYASDSSLTGKANFGFVSKYKKGQPTPTGNTEFQFKAGDLNFHSDSYEWLVIAGHKAMYKGTGTINGDGNFGFMLSAIDEKLSNAHDVDMFRIKIWDKDDGDAVVYDNNIGNDDDDDADPTTEIAGGQIVIHKK